MQDLLKQQADWFKTWQENQKNLTSQYAELSQEWLSSVAGSKQKQPDAFEGWFKSQGDLTEQFKEFGKRMNETINNAWGNKLPAEVMKFMNISMFEEFYKNWLSNLELPGGIKNPLGLEGGWQQASSFLRSFVEKEHPFFASFGSSKIADQMSWVFGMLQGVLGKEENAFGDLMNGYQDLFGKLFDSTTTQGTEKLAEGFEKWAKELEKYLLAPKLGINRELVHEVTEALVMSKDYIQQYIKMTRLVEAASRKAGIRFQTKLGELALKKKPVNKFSDFCALWAVENEAVFMDILGSQEFSRLQGDFGSASNRLKIQWNKLAEKVLEPSPVALNRDLDLAIAEIHQLKRDVKALQRSLKEKDREIQSMHESSSAAAEAVKEAKAARAEVEQLAKKVAACEKNVTLAAAEKSVKIAASEKSVKAATSTTTKSKSKNA